MNDVYDCHRKERDECAYAVGQLKSGVVPIDVPQERHSSGDDDRYDRRTGRIKQHADAATKSYETGYIDGMETSRRMLRLQLGLAVPGRPVMADIHTMHNAEHADRERQRQLRDLAPEILRDLVAEYERVCDQFCKQPARCAAYRRAVEVLGE
ncbi:MAG: hypothetical protein IPM06_21700 [Rhizobiales bacterium]|nr:hypothetical protein [Hyphomicrobiales bacterium]